MKTLIIYDSIFGNTQKIAASMADALGATLARPADTAGAKDVELLLVGSPTRAFRPTPAIVSWLKKLPAGALSGVRAAAFDTRINPDEVDNALLKKMVKRFGYAAEKIHKQLAKKGADMAAGPEGFFVKDSEGPLKDGELKRATDWASGLVQP